MKHFKIVLARYYQYAPTELLGYQDCVLNDTMLDQKLSGLHSKRICLDIPYLLSEIPSPL